MAFTDYLDDKLLRHVFAGQSFTAPSNMYVGLGTNSTTELDKSSYARQLCSFSVASNVASNTSTLTWTLGEQWGTITHAFVYDALTGGNKLVVGQLTTSLDGNNTALKIRLDPYKLNIRLTD